MEETFRWFGPEDSVTLANILQAGARGVVTALDHIATGEVWPVEEIAQRKALIESHGLTWSVVESVPLHNDIKTRKGEFEVYLRNYQQTIRNLGEQGINRICYNFMPVVDWTRTNLNYELPNKAEALRFEMADFAAYDIYMLQRPGSEASYPAEVIARARQRFELLTGPERLALEKNIIAGLPGGEGSYNRAGISAAIAEFSAMGTEGLRGNFFAFLKDIVPVAEESNVCMCVHPDDPPFSLFGLPRVVSTADDARALLQAVPSPANGLTMCAGSYGARSDNDLVAMIREFGSHIQFVHLRNIRRLDDGSFYESDHLDGDNDIVGVVDALLQEESERPQAGAIPMRPDHGHAIGDEKGNAGIRPGYSFAGRMKGLAELRGVIHTLTTLRRRSES